MNFFIAELVATCVLIFLGNGVVANVVLKNTKGHAGGWLVITVGWAMAVYIAVLVAQGSGLAVHMNPVFTLLAGVNNTISWQQVIWQLLGQFTGAALGALLVFVTHYHHFTQTEDASTKLACFACIPTTQYKASNFFNEAIFTALLVLAAKCIQSPPSGSVGSISALPISLVVLGIGTSLGGTTGYAINPFRDAAPRLVHTLLPFFKKDGSQWTYGVIPLTAPFVGGLAANELFKYLQW
jgi:glycerol uptake facilitator protein